MHQLSPQASRQPATKNRFLAALAHIPLYSGRFHDRLSEDTGLSVYRLHQVLYGKAEPSHAAVLSLTAAISKRAGFAIPSDELVVPFSEAFPTTYICELFKGCKCLPPWAWTQDGSFDKRFEGIPPGQWHFSVPSSDNPINPNS